MIQDSDVIDVDDFLAEHRRKINEDKRVLSDILNCLQEKQQDNDLQLDDSLNRLDRKSTDFSDPFSAQDLYKDDHRRVMVRYGEFSPLNPAFRLSSRPLLGLGEYEERRKIILERKKREYLQYLLKAKNEKEREKAKLKISQDKENENNCRLSNANASTRTQDMPREIFSPGRGLIEDTDRRCQQQAYRKELDRQISEKRRRLKEEKQRDREECEKKQKEMMMEQMKLTKSIIKKLNQCQKIERSNENDSHVFNIQEKENQETFYQNHITEEAKPSVHQPSCKTSPAKSNGVQVSPSRTSSPVFNPAGNHLHDPEHLSKRIASPLFNIGGNHLREPEHLPKRITSPLFNIGGNHLREPEHLPKQILSPLFNTGGNHLREPDHLPKRIFSPLFNTAGNHTIDIAPRSHRMSSSIFGTSDHLRDFIPSRAGSPVLARGSLTKAQDVKSLSYDLIESSPTASKKLNLRTSVEVDDPELYHKLQKEKYKNELAKQIEEKRRIEMERKRKEDEEEKRIEQKAKAEEEKLRKEFEKEQAERAYRAAQKVQQEVRLQEHLRKIQKETEERKKVVRPGPSVGFPQPSVFPTDHGVTNKGSMKNVSFAPSTYVYSFPNPNGFVQSNEITSTEDRKSDSDVILEAPYTLAVKGNETNGTSNQNGVTNHRPSSPPVPAIRTKNLMKSFPKADDIIPSTVSMSKETKEKFLKDAKILSSLSEIRRKLLENQTDFSTE